MSEASSKFAMINLAESYLQVLKLTAMHVSRTLQPFESGTFLLLVANLTAFMLAGPLAAQIFVPNYDESRVPHYSLPDPLVDQSGKKIVDAKEWPSRRKEIVELFKKHVYGRSPQPIPVIAKIVATNDQALSGKAMRREIDLTLRHEGLELTMSMLVYTPQGKTQVPTYLGLNFQGNHTLEKDPTIRISTNWMRNRDNGSVVDNRATELGRGIDMPDWPAEMIVQRGYGLATIYYGDIDPDFDDGFQNGIHPLFAQWAASQPAEERWGSIAAWAYGLSRALDYLQSDPLVDGGRVAVIGHSRLGKTALWAGAQDERFKLVISNNSGCGGAALSRRAFGETVGRINRAFPHWFCLNHRNYSENESDLPVDHHQLIALMAPRGVYVASASEDRWADPRGEYLSCVHADPVYRLLGTHGLGGDHANPEMPPLDQPLQLGPIGYHYRTGEHALTPTDWQHYLDFADKNM
jgi:hypothetical protein